MPYTTRQIRRSMRRLSRQWSHIQTRTFNFVRSKSCITFQRQYSSTVGTFGRSIDNDDGDLVFYPVQTDGPVDDNHSNPDVVNIPCEICSIAFPSHLLDQHQRACQHRPESVRRRRREPRRTRSDSLVTHRPVASAPLAPTSAERSPSPDDAEVPEHLVCPISGELFKDPVVAKDGITYEREEITTWLRTQKTSPMTREAMSSAELYPNIAIRNMADAYRDERQAKRAFYKYTEHVDVKKSSEEPMSTSNYKSVYQAEWLNGEKRGEGSKIVLARFVGDHAKRMADSYQRLAPHPNLPFTHGAVRPEGPDLLLVQEDPGDQTLAAFVQKSKPLSLAVRNRILGQIIDALLHLEPVKIMHGAVTMENVMIHVMNAKKNDVRVKLRSMGEYTNSSVSSIGTYSAQPDVFAFGILALELYSLAGESSDTDEALRLMDAFHRCTSNDPNQRPSFHDLSVILSPWSA